MKLSRGSPSPLTSSPAFLGTFMYPKTPGKDLKEKDKREDMVKMFHLYGVMEDIEVPDTAGDDVRGLGEALESFRILFFKIRQQDRW